VAAQTGCGGSGLMTSALRTLRRNEPTPSLPRVAWHGDKVGDTRAVLPHAVHVCVSLQGFAGR